MGKRSSRILTRLVVGLSAVEKPWRRVDTRLRFYAAAYGYRLDDQAGPASLGSVSGTVLLAGIRATL